jgi:hypothetical protein
MFASTFMELVCAMMLQGGKFEFIHGCSGLVVTRCLVVCMSGRLVLTLQGVPSHVW